MSSPPPDDFLPARLRALAFIREGEQRIGRTWFRALTRFLDRVRPGVTGSGGVDPGRVSDHAQFWTDQVNVEIMPVVSSVLTDAWRRVTAAGDPAADPWTADYLNEAGNRLVRLPDEVYALIVAEVERGIREQDDIPTVTKAIDTVLTATGSERWPNRARVVARTETMAAVNGGVFRGAVLDAEQRGDPAPFKAWLATADQRTRPTHRDADQQQTLLTSPFVVGGASLMYPGDPRGPAQEVIQCFPGDVRVTVPSGVVRVYRRAYKGQMIRIKMGDGVELSATPNHPLLTETGWVAAELVKVGNKLCGSTVGPGVGLGEPDIQDAPPTFHELYRAAVKAGVPYRVAGSTVDFHGDGSDGEVEVVLPHSQLRREVESGCAELVGDEPFIRLGDGQVPLPLLGCGQDCTGSADRPELGSSPLSGSSVGGSGKGLALLRGVAGHTDSHGFAAVSDRKPQFVQAPDDDRPTDPVVVRESLNRLPGGVLLREVIEVDSYPFHGDVFNLEAGDGWYIANNTASGNCRCTMLPIVLGEPIDWTDRQNARGE